MLVEEDERGRSPELDHPHGDFGRESLAPPAFAGDFARIWMRGTSDATLPQSPLLLVVAGLFMPSRAY